MPPNANQTLGAEEDDDLHSLALLGRLAPGIAHELNTLLGVVVTAASHFSVLRRDLVGRLGDGTLSRDDLLRYLNQAEQAERLMLVNLERAAGLTRSFKHVTVAGNHAEFQDVLVADFLEDVAQSAHGLLRKCPHDLRLDCPPDLLVRTVPGPLAGILLNLFANTARHAIGPRGRDTPPVSITIRASLRDAHTWTLTYSDTGRGIAPEVAARVFEPYVTTRRGQGGSGLGLSIVHDQATGPLGGSVELSSRPGHGVTFRFVFPLRLAAAGPIPGTQAPNETPSEDVEPGAGHA